MICDKGEKKYGEIIFNNFMGILLGPMDLPDFKAFITSDTSNGAVGLKKMNGDESIYF